jgi:hypothetical protein
MTLSPRERLHWVTQHAGRDWKSCQVETGVSSVAAAIERNLQHDFPSVAGVPVIAGRLWGSNPVQVELRAFPRGARIGKMKGGQAPGNWFKPTLVGRLTEADAKTTFRYRIDTQGVSLLVLILTAAGLLGLLCAIPVAIVASLASAEVIAIASIFVLWWCFVVMTQVERGMQEEAILQSWVNQIVGPTQVRR